MSPPRSASRPWLIDLVLLAALWGASFLFMRVGAAEFGPLPVAALRVGIAALVLVPLVLLRGQGEDLRRHWRVTGGVGMLNSGLPFALFSFALLTIPTGLAAVINATVPMFGALVAWAVFGDRPDGSRALGLMVGFAGVALLASGTTGLHTGAGDWPTLWAVLACLGACLCYGLSASAARRWLQPVPPLVNAAGSQIGATALLVLPAALTWPGQMPGLRAWLALVALGVACTGLAYILFFRLIARAGPAKALTVTFLVPVFAVFYGWVFLGERVTAWMLGCALVIVCGVALSSGLVRLPRWRGAA
ncbi:DMT family transporter [Pseudacidovorax intermedius]|uniref:Membrane protein n=1 Tax=Pseudacidovorax intermedius TaxID=433924 RepID=A0A147HCR0_9BURK|nr:DMT family transporter [Pseudacidovorax intermedius]KTT27779.1 membrane protein [Pseudacidovorax intermedius]